MSTLARYERPGLLERLTDSTAFAVLLVMASLVLAPVVLMGLFAMLALPSLLTHAWDVGSEGLTLLLLPAGGVIGYVGLFRARHPSSSATGYRATLICLGIGMVTAATVAIAIVRAAGLDDVKSACALVPAIPIVAALGRIARLRRLRAAAERRVPDSLPLIFLAVALAEALCAIVINLQLASAS
jgi:hypothetical protein